MSIGYGYVTLFIGYIILCIGVFYYSYAKGSYDCNPIGNYLDECHNIGTNDAPKFVRTRYIPNESGEKDPDGSIKYILQQDESPCLKKDCKVGSWVPDGGCYKDSKTNTSKQNWKRKIEDLPQYGGKPCPAVSATVNCGDSPTESFRFLRRRRARLGIEANSNYIGGIIGIVVGCIFITVGYSIVFTVKD
jgi:hypothetical protein